MKRNHSEHVFSQVPRAEIPRSVFDRSHGYKTAFDSGYLIPFFCDEVLPGDTFNLNCTLFSRLSTPVVPFMDNLYLDTFFFFVPNRLVWDHWQAFNGEQRNPTDSTDYLLPTVNSGSSGFAVGSIFDYLGLPTGVPNLTVQSLPLRACNLIYNEWFRDENLQNSLTVETGDTDSASNYSLFRRGKRHDYFTSCLPFPQKGPGVEISIGASVPLSVSGSGIISDGNLSFRTGGLSGTVREAVAVPLQGFYGITKPGDPNADRRPYAMAFSKQSGTLELQQSVNNGLNFNGSGDNVDYWRGLKLDVNNIRADLSAARPISINDLRQAFQLQRLYERDARGGTRYIELLKSHFGVTSPDARLQRPEYLGGSHSMVTIKPVQQTSASNDVTPQGNLAANGVVGDSFHGFNRSFVEHGYIIGFVCITADLTYQQGINRMWSRSGRFDFYWPSLAHLGEQAVLNKEIYAQGTADDDRVFGYQERYAEYRYFPSQITGKMRSTDPQSLDVWHLAQKFNSLPVLSSQFIEENPPVKRVLAVQDEPEFIFDSFFSMKCIRPMPLYGTPGLVDHF